MTSRMIWFVPGDWDGGHHGRFPVIGYLNADDGEKPLSMSAGWGWGLGGGRFSFKSFAESDFINDLNCPAGRWLHDAIRHVTSNGLSHERACAYLLAQLEGNEPAIPDCLLAHLNGRR